MAAPFFGTFSLWRYVALAIFAFHGEIKSISGSHYSKLIVRPEICEYDMIISLYYCIMVGCTVGCWDQIWQFYLPIDYYNSCNYFPCFVLLFLQVFCHPVSTRMKARYKHCWINNGFRKSWKEDHCNMESHSVSFSFYQRSYYLVSKAKNAFVILLLDWA